MATQRATGGHGGHGEEGTGQSQGTGRTPRSLVISPNLDALLEYDEQARGVVETGFSGPGLPPPPRRSRRLRSPRSPVSPGSPWGAWGSSPSTPNPYINSPPVIAKTEMIPEGDEEEGPADGGRTEREGGFGLDVSNSPERGLKFVSPPHAKRRLQILRKMEFGVDIRRFAVHTLPSPPLTAPDMPRPLLSHASWRRPTSSSSSSSSSSGASSARPASTVDARISISSTIYPASSAHSHPHHMYDNNDHDYYASPAPIVGPQRTSSLAESLASSLSSFAAASDRASLTSFIDIASPSFSPSPIIPVTIPDSRLDIQTRSQPVSRTNSPSPKPPIPTTPKPHFSRRPRPSPPLQPPSTTNFLDLDERSDLVRKNRKLARLFGQNPGPQQEVLRHHRAALSFSSPLDLAVAPLSGRRHSAPLSPEDLRFKTPAELYALDHAKSSPSSPTSFIDLSDEPVTPRKPLRRPGSPSNQSLFENMTPEEQQEEGRRRKREKLAKLHRFLGSRVPANLVLDLQDPEASLPPPPVPPLDVNTGPEERRAWLRRRRSSSAAAYSSTWSDDLDRVKEDLNDKEKAINVRRAHKMEKVFGIAPPQTLYHTRRSPSPAKVKPARRAVSPPANPNRSAYTKSPKLRRPGTSESAKQLLPKRSPSPPARRRTSVVYSHYQHSLNSLNDIIDRDDRASLAELHQYLASGDMTLAPPSPAAVLSPTMQEFARAPGRERDRRLSTASSLKSERRRSLPARTSVVSLASLASEMTVSTPRPEVTDFQARRRRAAKLTQFFGVDYRELISDVLESIESGLEHERKRGTLRADEVEDLLARLRGLRTKRGGLF